MTAYQAHLPTAAGAQDQRREDARQYVRRLRAVYIHAGVCAASLVIIFVVNLVTNFAAGITSEWWAWWSGWALIGCALALTVHRLVVWMSRPQSHTSEWEEKQINKVLLSTDVEQIR